MPHQWRRIQGKANGLGLELVDDQGNVLLENRFSFEGFGNEFNYWAGIQLKDALLCCIKGNAFFASNEEANHPEYGEIFVKVVINGRLVPFMLEEANRLLATGQAQSLLSEQPKHTGLYI